MEDTPDELVVEFEEVGGKRRIKLLPDGSHPLDTFIDVVKVENKEYKKTHNGYDGYDVDVIPIRGPDGGSDYDAIVVYHTPYGQVREIVSKTILVDKATGEPVVYRGAAYQKHDSPLHAKLTFTAELLREKAAQRALHLRAGDMRKIKGLKEKLEGRI
jgi:hypothetical protein